MGDAQTALGALKEATRAMHERLESAPRLARLIEPDLSRNEYRAVLERLLGFYEPAESALGAHGDRLPFDFDARRKTHLLVRDLERLVPRDASPRAVERRFIDELPRCPYVPPVPDVDSALGVLYVLEGSTLGGRIIRRHLERSIGITPDCGGAYYTGYGKHTGQMWKALGRAINNRVAESGSVEPLVVSACATFTALNRWITR